MDNFRLEIVARHDWALEFIVRFILEDCRDIRGYYVNADTLQFYHIVWEGVKPTITEFPYPQKADQLIPFIKGWLDQVEYPREPDIDGSVSKGWQITTSREGWSPFTFAVQPVWAMHHK